MDARVHAGGDWGLDLQGLACQVLVVSITIVQSDAAGVPQGGSGLVAHGVVGPRENVAPQELTFQHLDSS